MVVILIVLPPPQKCQQSTDARYAQKYQSRIPSNRFNSHFEPVRTHSLLSSVIAASPRSPYQRTDQESSVRLRTQQPRSNQSQQHLDRNNNYKRALWDCKQHQRPRQSFKRSVNNRKHGNYANDNSLHNKATNPSNLRYTSRVIISDDFSQVDVRSDDSEVQAVSREEEIIKKRKTELTTTRQIETRIKRQIVFEDGKVIEDSGPVVSTNTTEDTDRQVTEQTEHRTLGDPTEEEVAKTDTDTNRNGSQKLVKDEESNRTIGAVGADSGPSKDASAIESSNIPKNNSIVVARPDGLLRSTKEEVAVSREETKECTVTEERKHLGDFTDDAYLRAINSGVDDIRELLLSEEARLELVASGPQLISSNTKSRKVTDTEDTDIQLSAKQDGTLVTEKVQTRQHEVVFDEDLPGDERLSTGVDQVDSAERIIDQKASSQRYFKQRDEQHVDLIGPNNEVIDTEMRYTAENTQMDKDGLRTENLISEWDSLSDRLRKARRLGRHSTPREAVGAVTGIPPLTDRTDALTKKPLDFDREDETRKHETNKWLESHFGSESRSSRGSRDDLDDIVEPTKRSYFNVTIKSGDIEEQERSNNSYKNNHLSSPGKVIVPEKDEPIGRKFFQGVSEWNNRERGGTSRGSKENLLDGDNYAYKQVGKQKDYRLEDSKTSSYKDDSAYVSSSTYFTTPRSPKHIADSSCNVRYCREMHSVSPNQAEYVPEERPTAPQRKKAMERKLMNAGGMRPKQHFIEPQIIEYVPRSRSISPIQIPPAASTLRKPYQKTRFSSIQDLSHRTKAQTGGNVRAQSTPPKSKVGSAIGNSIRKLVGKIRSASAERKLRLKSSKNRRTPSPSISILANNHAKRDSSSSATYQQYNVIDGHIGQGYSPPPITSAAQNLSHRPYEQHQRQQSQSLMSINSASHKQGDNIARRERDRERADFSYERRVPSDIVSDMTTNSGGGPIPKQKYYLGENPYGGSIFGKENKYDGTVRGQAAYPTTNSSSQHEQQREEERIVAATRTRSYSQPPQPTASTLGRLSKSTNRLYVSPSGFKDHNGSSSSYVHSPANHYQNSSQTLPRKLYDHKGKAKPLQSSTINVSIVNTVSPTPHPLTNTGPVKPARTYKALNRSKSFNVHGLNGTNDPSPIYLEKITKNNYGSLNRSNSNIDDFQHIPSRHQNESTQLKSPSIVNLVSRSTRDLTQIPLYEDEPSSHYHEYSTNKKNVFLKNLQNRAPELYRTLHDGTPNGKQIDHVRHPSREYLNTYISREQESSLGSRSPLTINKDTASIVRRGSSSTEDYTDSYKTNKRIEDTTKPGSSSTTRNFSKKVVPAKDGRGVERIETSEIRTTSTSRYKDQPGNSPGLKYQEFRNESHRSNSGITTDLKNK